MRSDIKQILRKYGLSAILVTHEREDAFYLADRIALIEQGRIIDIGTPKSLYEMPKNTKSAEFLGAVNIIESSAIANVKNAMFRKWLESKNGMIRPKELQIVDLRSADSQDLRTIQAEVVENIFYGDYYEIIVCVESLNFSLQLPYSLQLDKITLAF